MVTKKRKTSSPKPKSYGHCRDCENAYDFHSISLKGEPILCRCKFAEYCKLLSMDGCSDKFKMRRNGQTQNT